MLSRLVVLSLLLALVPSASAGGFSIVDGDRKPDLNPGWDHPYEYALWLGRNVYGRVGYCYPCVIGYTPGHKGIPLETWGVDTSYKAPKCGDKNYISDTCGNYPYDKKKDTDSGQRGLIAPASSDSSKRLPAVPGPAPGEQPSGLSIR